jgi:hypothetical protein
MIAFATMLAEPASAAGIPVPPDPDEFDRDEFPRFSVFCIMQLGAPMPYPAVVWDNAKVIAGLPEERVKEITYTELVDLGFSIGYSSV